MGCNIESAGCGGCGRRVLQVEGCAGGASAESERGIGMDWDHEAAELRGAGWIYSFASFVVGVIL